MKKRTTNVLLAIVGLGCLIAIISLGYIYNTQKKEIEYLQEANALLQSDYEKTSKELKETEAENEILTSQNEALMEKLEKREAEIKLVNEALQIAKDAINSLQAKNTSGKNDESIDESTDEGKSDSEDDTLTEKDLQTLKEKVLAGEMNDYLKDVIGSMNKLQLLQLAKELGLI